MKKNIDEKTFNKNMDIIFIKAINPKPRGTIMFIHGFSSSYLLHNFFVFKNEFVHYNYLAINLKGHQLNTNHNMLEEYDLHIYVDELVKFIVQHHLSNLILIGHSMGGAIALLIYELIPTHIQKIILVAAINNAIYQSRVGLGFLKNTFLNKSKKIKLMEFHNNLKQNNPYYKIMDEYINYEIERYLLKKRKFLFLGFKLIEPTLYNKLNKIYKNINIPVLYLIGKHDKIIPYKPTRNYFNKLNNPHIIFKTINDSGHVPFIDNFDEYNKYVWWFIHL